jgi:hypothetical protein
MEWTYIDDGGDDGYSQSKNNKAVGFVDIPAEVLKSPRILDPMWKLCNNCFVTGSIPSAWSTGIINSV